MQEDEPTLVATVQPPTAEVPVEEPVEEPAPPIEDEEQAGFNLISFLSGALAGTLATLGGIFGIIGRLKNDTAALNAIEWLGKSIPVDALTQLNELGRNLRDAGEVLDKVTDGLPNAASVPAREPLSDKLKWLEEGG